MFYYSNTKWNKANCLHVDGLVKFVNPGRIEKCSFFLLHHFFKFFFQEAVENSKKLPFQAAKKT